MSDAIEQIPRTFPHTRRESLNSLLTYIPKVVTYAKDRNFVSNDPTTSCLSPAIRRRLITEEEVIGRVLDGYSFQVAEKFLQEVVWRTYWKGWLEGRVSVWEGYLRTLESEAHIAKPSIKEQIEKARSGHSGIKAFDDWTSELCNSGYLHNHVRMWWASIWIFTLGLPWQAGAQFFLEHLLDGDPASNTLSWRWVAGLQTAGKHYLARADNISKYTEGAVKIPAEQLVETAGPLHHVAQELSSLQPVQLFPTELQTADGVLLHPEDLSVENTPVQHVNPRLILLLPNYPTHAHSRSKLVVEYEAACFADSVVRVREIWPTAQCVSLTARDEVLVALENLHVRSIFTMRPFAGFVRQEIQRIEAWMLQHGVTLQYLDRNHDAVFLPLASRGFFPFWEKAAHVLRSR